MTLVSNVNGVSAPLSDSTGFARPNARKNPMSLAHLAKTAGVLALALGGGGQVAGARNSFDHGRELEYESDPKPYDYASICKSGIIDSYIEGLNYEDCTAQEEAAIEAVRQDTPFDNTKKCYTVTGYMTLGLAGGSALSTIGCSSAGLATAVAGVTLGSISLFITTVCGIWHGTISSRLRDSRDVAEKCCRFFPKQADIEAKKAEAAASTSNATALPPIPATPAPLPPTAAAQATLTADITLALTPKPATNSSALG